LLPGLLVIACNDENTQSRKSKVKVEEIKNDTVDTKLTYYYPSDTVKAIYHRKDSLLHGPFEEYYQNGGINQEGGMYKGRTKGTVAFYDSATGKLIKYINYVPLGND